MMGHDSVLSTHAVASLCYLGFAHSRHALVEICLRKVSFLFLEVVKLFPFRQLYTAFVSVLCENRNVQVWRVM